MISSIQNPWLRRPLLVIVGPLWFGFILLCDIGASIQESGADLARAWRGPRRG